MAAALPPPDLTLPTVEVTAEAPQPLAAPGAMQGLPPTLQGIDPSLAGIVQRESRGRPYVGYTSPETFRRTGQFTNLASAPVDSTGAPIWSGDEGPEGISHAFGPAQIEPGTWRPIARRLGITDWRTPGAYARVVNELHREAGGAPWRASGGEIGTKAQPQSEPPVAEPQLNLSALTPARPPTWVPPPAEAGVGGSPGGLGLMVLGSLLKGVRYTPVDYDPFKIWKLGVTSPPSYRLGSIGGKGE